MGLILRLSKPFKSPDTLKILYSSYVRSVLEFGCIVWTPQYTVHKTRIERIQNKLLKSLNFRHGLNLSEGTSRSHGLAPLVERRVYIDQMFLYKLLNNYIDSPNLLQKVIFKLPRRIPTRYPQTFHISFCGSNFAKHTFFRRACHDYNVKFSNLDIFSLSFGKYSSILRSSIFS